MNAESLTINEAADLAGVIPKTMRNLVERGTIPSIKTGTRRFVTRKDVLTYCRRRPLTASIFTAEWHHFTTIMGMSEAKAAEVIGERYGIDPLSIRQKARRLGKAQAA